MYSNTMIQTPDNDVRHRNTKATVKPVIPVQVRLHNDNILINTAPNKYELVNNVIAQRDAAFAALRRIEAAHHCLAQEEYDLITKA